MAERVLISTFGFDPEKVLRALRWLGYDRLAVIAGGKSLREPGLRKLEAAERASGGTLEVLTVDPFDFRSCFEGAVRAIRRHRKSGREVRMNVSGGTKVVADAALLAAFQEGVEAWYCEDEPLKLPVLKGVSFADGLTAAQRDVLAIVERPRAVAQIVSRLRDQGHAERAAQVAINGLRDQGLVTITLRDGAAIVSVDPRAEWFVRTLS